MDSLLVRMPPSFNPVLVCQISGIFWCISTIPVDSLFRRKDWNRLHVIQAIFCPKLPLQTANSFYSWGTDAFIDAIEDT